MDTTPIYDSVIFHPERSLAEHYNAAGGQTGSDVEEAVSILESTDRLMHTSSAFVRAMKDEEQYFHQPKTRSDQEPEK